MSTAIDITKYNPSNRGRETGVAGGRRVDLFDSECLVTAEIIEAQRCLQAERDAATARAIEQQAAWRQAHPDHAAAKTSVSKARQRKRVKQQVVPVAT